MSRQLQELARDLRVWLQWQRVGSPGVVPAEESERQAFEAIKAERRARKTAAMRQALLADSQPPPPKAPRQEQGSAPRSGTSADTSSGATPLWKELGSQQKRVFGEAAAGDHPWAADVTDKGLRLEAVREKLGDCKRCELCETRTNIVFGTGNPQARLMFIGEGPGEEEDKTGEPFVGRAGQLLDRMIKAMGLSREEVYIANVVKCRPPENRNPKPEEVALCSPFLRWQVEAIQPEVIVTLGRFASQTILQSEDPMSKLRSRWHRYSETIAVMPTYHPAYVLRSPDKGRPAVWHDLQLVMQKLGLTAEH